MNNYLSPTELASTEHKPIDKVKDIEALEILLSSQRGAVEVVFENINRIKNLFNMINLRRISYFFKYIGVKKHIIFS